MILTLGKRVPFEAAYRLDYPDWSKERFQEQFGKQLKQDNVLGGNVDAWFVFSGPVDDQSGMMINVADIKARVGALLSSRYDHKFLNDDNPAFTNRPPTVENIARQLFDDAAGLFQETQAKLYACHLVESSEAEATAYADRVERQASVQFSAARRTVSPFLSENENKNHFGSAVNDHGHYYDLRVTLAGNIQPDSGQIVPEARLRQALNSLYERLDHKHLNDDLPELKKVPLTTEALARWMFNELARELPLERVTLSENPWFAVDYDRSGSCRINLIDHFRAAHRLHSPLLSDSENLAIFGKCNNLNGHGHRYRLQVGISAPIDEYSGTVMNLIELINVVKKTVAEWEGAFIDREFDIFKTEASTSENIVGVLHEQLERELRREVARLRLWETDNNRFTLRRQGSLTNKGKR